MRAILKNRNICVGNKEVDFNSLFSNATIEASNAHANEYFENICIINELYEEFVLPSFDADSLINDYSVTEIDLKDANEELRPVFEYICRKNKVRIVNKSLNIGIKIKSKIYKLGAFVYLLYKQIIQKYEPTVFNYSSVVFTRSKSTRQKFSKMLDIDMIDEFKPGYGSIYSQIGRFKRISLLFKALKYRKKYEKDLIGYLKKFDMQECIPFSLYYYSKRFIHTAFYGLVEDYILTNNNWTRIYTGNNLDRFAFIEESLSKKHQIKLICIPHGIEYGYKFPKCFIGDEFYTTSRNASIVLNNLYNTNKFVFSSEIGDKMFRTSGKSTDKRRIVYFSEPREFEVNIEILNGLHEMLNKKGIRIYLKLHPIDNPENYQKIFDLGIEEIKDFIEAVYGNICVARKSTTLLEATYNESEAVAILVNEKDRCIFESFPSLSDERIRRFDSIIEAGKYLGDRATVSMN